MKYESSRLRALATSSQRLNKMLLLLTSLALLLVSMSYWAVGRVFEEESDKVDFHFARLIESIHEHESFLKQAAQGYSRAHQNVVTYVQPFSSKLIMLGDDEEVYQVKGLAMSIPFTLAKRNEYSDEAMRGTLSWGGATHRLLQHILGEFVLLIAAAVHVLAFTTIQCRHSRRGQFTPPAPAGEK